MLYVIHRLTTVNDKNIFKQKTQIVCSRAHTITCVACVYLCATRRLLGISYLALVGHTGGLLLAELDVSVSCTLVEPPLTVRALDIV